MKRLALTLLVRRRIQGLLFPFVLRRVGSIFFGWPGLVLLGFAEGVLIAPKLVHYLVEGAVAVAVEIPELGGRRLKHNLVQRLAGLLDLEISGSPNPLQHILNQLLVLLNEADRFVRFLLSFNV